MFICHFRNEKETGAKMSPAIVSGIVNKDAISQYATSEFQKPSLSK